ncbi:hypothetical protein [Methylomagnum sp.]
MYLEAFIWSWINLHPGFVLKKLAKLMALAALVLLPLLYINVDMARKGFTPTPPRLELQVAHEPIPGSH